MSYKPNTPVIEESQGIMLAERLVEEGYRVTIHDPLSLAAASKKLGANIDCAETIEGAFGGADIAVLTTAWSQYKTLAEIELPKRIPIIDCWRLLPAQETASFEVVWLGFGPRRSVALAT